MPRRSPRHPHRSHRLTAPLPRSREPSPPRLPRNCFGALTGAFERASAGSRYRNVPDDNHVYLWIRIGLGPHAGCFECAVNVASPAPGGHLVPVLFHERDERIAEADVPAEGFSTDARCSYAGLGLREGNFTEVPHMTLGPALIASAQASVRVAVYGVTYANGEGMHDIHLNSHETPGSRHRDRLDSAGHPTQDGALIFYSRPPSVAPGVVLAHWVFIKFRTQVLPPA
jgi:hypothetical protein